MKNAAISRYLSNKPCVICSADTRIESANDAAVRTGKLLVGDTLSANMSPLDVLKFEASVKSVFSQPTIIIPVSIPYTNGVAAVYFEEIMGRYFAIVAFFKNFSECESSVAADDTRKQPEAPFLEMLIEDLIQIPDKSFSRRTDVGMFRAADLAERAVRDIAGSSTFFDCDVSFECSPLLRNDVSFSGIGLPSFLKAVSLIMYAVNDLSSDRKMTVYTSSAGSEPQLSFKTFTKRTVTPARNADALATQVPSVGAALALSNYIAGCSGFRISAKCDADGIATVTFWKNYAHIPGLEFKCRDCCEDYEYGISEAVRLLDGFTELNTQQKNQH